MNEIQKKYRERQQQRGLKRKQIWIYDETNLQLQNRIKIGAQIANQAHDEIKMVEELTSYIHSNLQKIPL